MSIILPIITAVICMISFFLLLRDMEAWDPELRPADTKGIPVPVLIYSLISVALTIGISIAFPKIYPANSVWINIKRMVLLGLLWPVAYIDFKTYRIPNLYIIFGLICRAVILVFELLLENPYVWPTLISEGIASVSLVVASLLCILVVKNGIGFGDIKLFIVMGLFLSLDGIWSAIFLTLVVSFFAAVFLLLSKKKTRKDSMPFGPAIVIGTYLSVFLTGM